MMHLAHPSLTTTGKKQGRRRWASADAKRQAQELEQSWTQLNDSWRKMSRAVSTKIQVAAAPAPYRRSSTQNIPSLPSTHVGAVSSRPSQQYTGDKIVGIGTLHKSNAVPVFSNEEAIELSKMRRG